MTGPVFLLPHHPNHDVVAVLTGLLEVAKQGDLNGLIFGAAFKGQKFYCDAAGTLHRNGVTGLGVAGMLWGELEGRLKHQSTETII